MPNLVVVALPSADDRVWRISSEEIPHMTILFLGEMPVPNFTDIAKFVEHAANRSLRRFSMEVDRRGTLGDEEADVLFFSKSRWHGYESVADFRAFLLKDSNIQAAYQSVDQFPEWLPHLTLGYPETPAKPEDSDYFGIHYVNFDRIALWFNDYEGYEYPLKAYEWDLEVAMDSTTERGRTAAEEALQHYGVKGMRWGIRRKRTASSDVKVSQRGKKLKTSGGEGRPASEDAIRSRRTQQIIKKSGLVALSNEELQAYNTRLNLEANARRLSIQEKNAGTKFVNDLIVNTGKNAAQQAANEAASRQVKRLFQRKDEAQEKRRTGFR